MSRFERFMLAVTLSLVAWQIVDLFIVEIALHHFLFIEILIALCELFATFIEKKRGDNSTENYSSDAEIQPSEMGEDQG